ncbi:CoA transferase, partial [Xanthomonas citri pv. citri]
CTMMLADHGASVIKIEQPSGDPVRGAGPYGSGDGQRTLGGFFQSINRNKRGICLDLKSSEGRDALKALVMGADAIIENFRSDVMDRLGLGYEVLSAINPKLVYGCLRGFGDRRTGRSPCETWPAYDVVAQAMGGMMSITGPSRSEPTKV